MELKETGWDDVDCVHLVQDMEKLRALTNKEMNLRVLYKVEDERLMISQLTLSSMEKSGSK
jgi:D-Tyr-tRNAtyr deacylase